MIQEILTTFLSRTVFTTLKRRTTIPFRQSKEKKDFLLIPIEITSEGQQRVDPKLVISITDWRTYTSFFSLEKQVLLRGG